MKSGKMNQASLNDKIKELERLCPRCQFEVREDMTIRITEYGRPFIVDLMELKMTSDEWFDAEIAKRPEPEPEYPDGPYNVFCPNCGKVNIGHDNYSNQMKKPNEKWHCPQCGRLASFDDESYEAYYD